MAFCAWISEKSDAVVWWLLYCLLCIRYLNDFLTLSTNLSLTRSVTKSLNFCSLKKRFVLVNNSPLFFQNQKSSLLNTNEPIYPAIHALCLCLLPSFPAGTDVSMDIYPLWIFPCFASNRSFIPSDNCKKKKKSHAAFDDYFFVIFLPLLFPSVWKKGKPTSLILLTRSYFKQQNTGKAPRHTEGDGFLFL